MKSVVKKAVLGAIMAFPAISVAAPVKPAAFAMCGTCHKVEKGQKSFLGPNLFGVGGRKAGSFPNYAYSTAMKGSKIVWTRPALIAFITNPHKTVPGTRMAFAGQKNPQVAAAIADYLLTLK